MECTPRLLLRITHEALARLSRQPNRVTRMLRYNPQRKKGGASHGHRFPVAQRVLWWDRYKFVLNFADGDELYDLKADGCEMDNLISRPEFRGVHQECRQRLLETMTDVDDTLGPQARHLLERSL